MHLMPKLSRLVKFTITKALKNKTSISLPKKNVTLEIPTPPLQALEKVRSETN